MATLASHPRSYWKGRSPSFDGLHAKDFPIGWMFQNNAFENYRVIDGGGGVWMKVGENEEGWEALPDLQPTPPNLLPSYPVIDIPKRKRGRPRKDKKQYILKNPSPWQLFVRERMPELQNSKMSGREKLQHLSIVWQQVQNQIRIQQQ
jgi:hypothetical protein